MLPSAKRPNTQPKEPYYHYYVKCPSMLDSANTGTHYIGLFFRRCF